MDLIVAAVAAVLMAGTAAAFEGMRRRPP